MVERFTLLTSGKITFGAGAAESVGNEAAALGRKAFIVADRHFRERGGAAEMVQNSCAKAGVEPIMFDSPPAGEPDLDTVERARHALGSARCDVAIALGGGSILDTAKAAAGLAREAGHVREYFDGRPVGSAGIPFIAMPTTAGSGAEATVNAVLSDPSRQIKQSIRDNRFLARVILADPRLTLSCPPRTTADSGMDALAQAIESFTSLGANPMTDALAFEAAQLILHSLVPAYRDGQNLDARSDMLLGSLMAGIALTNARLGAIHGLAHPLGIRWHIPHGRICAILLAPVMRFNESVAGAKYARLSDLAGENIIGHVERLRDMLDIPADLKEYHITADEVEWVVKESLPSGSLKMNPRPARAEDLRAILAPLV
ncbi:MAG: iron-containing alcohol dehydrogenase [Candidatus Sumerlaeia bacterium]|nr:iron-containing alcohol dehydrogenase [Candidatus Sumerlaeia bacterium]